MMMIILNKINLKYHKNIIITREKIRYRFKKHGGLLLLLLFLLLLLLLLLLIQKLKDL